MVLTGPCVLLLLAVAISFSAASQYDDDLVVVKQRMWDATVPASVSTSTRNTVTTYITTMTNGSWAAINYNDQNQVTWATAAHIQRILTLAQTWSCNHSSNRLYFHNATLLDTISKGLNHWMWFNYMNPNWWFNVINLPSMYGPICMLMQTELTVPQGNFCVVVMKRSDTTGMTGANLVWTAFNRLYLGVYMVNVTELDVAFKNCYHDVILETGAKDGIKADGSFFQHSTATAGLVYSGGYGYAFVSSLFTVFAWGAQTIYAISPAQMAYFESMLLDGQQWMSNYNVTRGHTWDINIKGREITRANGMRMGITAANVRSILPGSPRAQELTDMANRIEGNAAAVPLLGNKAFWMGDMVIHRRVGWTVSYRMFSRRTISNECVNNEGKQSLHLGDGALYMYQSGQEYVNLFPAWNWKQIPGTTVEQDLTVLNCNQVKANGKTRFVGSASDGSYSVSAFDFQGVFSSRLAARKAVFLLDWGYVALGVNISSPLAGVRTTVEQNYLSLLSGVRVSDQSVAAGAALPSNASLVSSNTWWVVHDSVAYLFPDAAPSAQFCAPIAGGAPASETDGCVYFPQRTPTDFSLQLSNTVQNGSWFAIGAGTTPQTYVPVFNLGIGRSVPSQPGTPAAYALRDSYSYVVVPNVNVQTWGDASAALNLQRALILANTALMQVIFDKATSMLAAAFYSANLTVPNVPRGFSVVTACPATLLLRETRTNQLKLTVAEPARLFDTVSLGLDRIVQCASFAPAHLVTACSTSSGGSGGQGWTNFTVVLPALTTDLAGSSVSVTFSASEASSSSAPPASSSSLFSSTATLLTTLSTVALLSSSSSSGGGNGGSSSSGSVSSSSSSSSRAAAATASSSDAWSSSELSRVDGSSSSELDVGGGSTAEPVQESNTVTVTAWPVITTLIATLVIVVNCVHPAEP